jgi:hypothetical protein
MMQVSVLQAEQASIGNLVKTSKKKFTWHFAVGDDVHCVELFVSFLSNKRKLIVDGSIAMQQGHFMVPLDFEFEVGGASVTVLYGEGGYDLEIQGTLFSQLMKQLTQEPEEPKHTEPVKPGFESWRDLGEIEIEADQEVRGLWFEECDAAYRKILAVQPHKPVADDLISFEELPAIPKPAEVVELPPSYLMQQMMTQLFQMNENPSVVPPR